MPNEAQARAGEPDGAGDNEYEAFHAVLSSSARGRAFLAEHARRARQTDTEMLLAAIARIEGMLAEHRLEAPPPASALGPVAAPSATALAAVAAQAIAAAEADIPEVTVIKAGHMRPAPHFAGEDFASAQDSAAADGPAVNIGATATAPDHGAESNVISPSVPPEHAAPLGTPVADALASILALSEEERLALFS